MFCNDFCSSDTFVKPNLWLLVNPNIACPIKYRVHAADPQPACEPAEESQTPLLEPAETRRPPTAELHTFPSQVELPLIFRAPVLSHLTLHGN